MNLAPIHIHPLLEIYALVNKADCYHANKSPNWAINDLVNEKLIEPDPRMPPFGSDEPHGWVITAKGKVFIEALLNTPMPVQVWRVGE